MTPLCGSLAFILQGLLVFARPGNQCPEDEYNACLNPVIEKVTIANTAFPYFNDSQLDSLCRACSGLGKCFEKVDMRHCDHLQLSYIEGVKKTCDYFCIEGPDYKKHRNCFNNSELQAEGSRCNYTFVRQETSLAADHGTELATPTHEDRVLWCKYVSEFISCMKDAVTEHCSATAGEWIMNINMQYYHPIMERMDCRIGSKVGVAVIFGVAVGLFVTMVAVIVTSVVCRRKQRQNRSLGNNLNTLSSTCQDKKQHKSQNGQDSNGKIHDKCLKDCNKASNNPLKQYYPEGESLLSSETSNNLISPNEVSTRNDDVTISGADQESEAITQWEQDDADNKKQLLVSDL